MARKPTNHRAATIIGKPRKLERWGNRLAVRLSSELLAAAEVTADQPFTMHASPGCIRLVFENKVSATTLTEKLDTFVGGMRLSDLVAEIDSLGSDPFYPSAALVGEEGV